MEINSVKTLIENKLACIDINTKHCEGHQTTRLNHELNGMIQLLRHMGFSLELDINPYFNENNIPSTYTLTLYEPLQ